MGKDVRMPRYVLPADLPPELVGFTALSVPLAWGVVRHLRAADSMTLRDLCAELDADDATVTKRLDSLRALGLVDAVTPEGVSPAHTQGHVVHYRLNAERLDALIASWVAYLRAAPDH